MKLTFGEFLKQKRVEKNITQKALSEMLFVSESTVSKWEKNVAHPDMSMLSELSEILGVTEHELISASIDENTRRNTLQARKWRNLANFWNLFFYICYGTALLTCFIVNLAVNGRLSWFFIVLSAIILSATFTTLPQFIKKNRIIFIPLSEFTALILLFGVCNLYGEGGWFLYATLPTLTGVCMVFLPIIISKTNCPKFIKGNNGYISIAVDFILLFIMFLYISIKNNTYRILNIALPLCFIALIVAFSNVFLIRIKTNRLLKSGIILLLWNIVYLSVGYGINPFLNAMGVDLTDSTEFLPFKFNFRIWKGDYITNNVTFIVFMFMMILSVIFILLGIYRIKKK